MILFCDTFVLAEIRHGAISEPANQGEAVHAAGSQMQSQGGHEYVPDLDIDLTTVCEDRPPTALPIAEPVVSIDASAQLNISACHEIYFWHSPAR